VPREVAAPVFGEPEPTHDPSTFRIKHPSDKEAYAQIDQLNREHKIFPLKFDLPVGLPEPVLTLEEVFGGNTKAINNINGNRQIVFHATGDCGSTRSPLTENRVTDKMLGDFHETDPMGAPLPKEVPQFNLLLGDIVYSFGERQYYYDQFYEPYRDYPAPVLAAAGNHDGMVSPLDGATSLEAFYRNFCDYPNYARTKRFSISPDAGGLTRTAQIQPGVFFTFEAPFVRILVIYSNTLEDPGVIAEGAFAPGGTIGNSQLDFLEAALSRVKEEKYAGALIIANHHPPYTYSSGGSRHGWSSEMLSQIDEKCTKVGVWPHAFLSGHAHNYQRFTRTRPDGSQIPYIVCGNGGHNVLSLTRKGNPAPRAPQTIQAAQGGLDQVVFENYDDQNYGYLRVVVTKMQLRIEYHPASDGIAAKTPDDSVTVDLGTRNLAHFVATDLGVPKAAKQIRAHR
jgi:hypothetical protein